jgi:hypothetical protein
MIDLSELARQQAERVRPRVRLAPVADIVAAGRRRRRRFLALSAGTTVVTIAATAGLLTAVRPKETQPPPPASTATPTIVLDGGALTIEPADQARPAFNEAYARAAAGQVIWPVVGPTTRVVLARVRSNLAPKPSSFDGTTVIPTSWSLAWVLLSTEVRATPCLMPLRPGTRPAGPPGTTAVIVDATSGQASVYLPNHDTCDGWDTPQLEPAEAEYSVPFQVDPSGTFSVHLPPCGSYFGAAQGLVRVEDQIVPIARGVVQSAATVRIGPCDRPGTIYRVTPPDVKAPYGHAPVGQMHRTPAGVTVDP